MDHGKSRRTAFYVNPNVAKKFEAKRSTRGFLGQWRIEHTSSFYATMGRWSFLILAAFGFGTAYSETALGETFFSKPVQPSLCAGYHDIQQDADDFRCEDHPKKRETDGIPLFFFPGIYQNTNNHIGAELSVARPTLIGVFGIDLGIQDDSAGYLEGELILWPFRLLPFSFGFGPRIKSGHVTPQTTVALPFFFIFPYWRWSSDDSMNDDATNTRRQEFGIMLKIPLTNEPARQYRNETLPI